MNLENFFIIFSCLFAFILAIFLLSFGSYLSIITNKQLEKIIYPKNHPVHTVTKYGGLPLGYMKAGEYGIHFALLPLFKHLKKSKRIKIELRNAPKATKIKYLIFFWSSVFWVFYSTGLYTTGTLLNW